MDAGTCLRDQRMARAATNPTGAENEKGAKLNVTVLPDAAYGKRSDDLIQKANIGNFNEPEEVKVGVQFQMQTPEGGMSIATVTEIAEEEVTIDLNHPLADMTLHFDVEVMDVREATSEELEHGHVHGEGGHNH